jgi:hypothetical protein
VKGIVAIGSNPKVLSVGLLPNNSLTGGTAIAALQAAIAIIQNEMLFVPELRVSFCTPDKVGPVEPLTPEECARREAMMETYIEVGKQIQSLGDTA